jgi:hypothetical protein
VRFGASPLPPEEAAAFAEQLHTALALRRIELCDASIATTSTAVAEIALRSGDAGRVTIVALDAVTEKRVERDVDLSALPPDSRALALAASADELLRASWAELLLVHARALARPAPKEVREAVAPAAPPQAEPERFEIGAGLSAEHYTGGYTALGPDVLVTVLPWERLGIEARFGFRSAFALGAPDGSVGATALVASLGARAALLPRAERFGVDLVLRGVLTHASFTATATGTVAASDGSGLAISGVGSAVTWMALVPRVRLFLEAGLGAPFQSVRAIDQGRPVAALSGLLAAGSLGLGGAW